MRKWECDVCGHIHEGEEAPEKCPVCDAPGSAFVLMLESDGEQEAKPVGRRWRCLVCGYVHEGEEPPETCPVCGAPRSKFVEIDVEGREIGPPPEPKEPATVPQPEQPAQPAEPAARSTFGGRFAGVSSRMHLHPISVHIPNGVLPVVLVFLGLSMAFGVASLETAAFYNLVFVLLSMPFVLFTGFLEWQRRYRGARTAIFMSKISAALIVLAAANVLVFWRILDPGVFTEGSPSRFIYLGVAAGMLAAAGFAGYLGGRLIYGRMRE